MSSLPEPCYSRVHCFYEQKCSLPPLPLLSFPSSPLLPQKLGCADICRRKSKKKYENILNEKQISSKDEYKCL